MNTPIRTTPIFKPFEWVPAHAQRGDYAMLSDIRDLSAGVKIALELCERSQIMGENDGSRLIDDYQAQCLVRMSIAAMGMVHSHIDGHFELLNEAAATQQNGGKE